MLNKNKILGAISLLAIISSNVYAGELSGIEDNNSLETSITKVEVIDKETLSISFDTNYISEINTNQSNIKVFQNLKINNVSNEDDKVVLSLQDSIIPHNLEYSLFSVSMLDANIDFLYDGSSNEIYNTNEGDYITKVNILNPNTLELYFREDFEYTSGEFNIIKELNVSDSFFDSNTDVYLYLNDNIESYSNYMVMVIELLDNNSNEISVSNSIYDFSSEEIADNVIENENFNEEIIEDNYNYEEDNLFLDEEFNAAGDELTEDNMENMSNIEDIALSATSTPNTGAQTYILMLLTILMTSIIFFRKKLS